MLSNVLTLSENTAYEVMTPRTKLSMVSKDSSLEEILHTFIDSDTLNYLYLKIV